MLFNSYEYLLAFLPLTLLGSVLWLRWAGRDAAIAWLVFASLFYYGWWNPIYVGLILASMAVNFVLGRRLGAAPTGPEEHTRTLLLTVGIIFNLGLLFYFKYANFFVDTVASLSGTTLTLAPIALPLAISFFTFQQIAYLVDAHRRLTREYSPLHYALFVSFFPQLIAGPIVHHAEMMPQFMSGAAMRLRPRNLAMGLSLLFIGLFKKVVLADGIAPYSTSVFGSAAEGAQLTFFEAWGGALAYTFQLYFDFSGYSDMAIGSAFLFGIRLPINFFSPYKATSIIEFWRRWHITLSRFLRDYLYIPLGGNRRGRGRRYVNLMATMVLGGLWHGAGWTFLAWGALHGLYLMINQAWRSLATMLHLSPFLDTWTWRCFAWLLTFIAVVIAWVLFRAETFAAAIIVLQGMAGLNGVGLPNGLVAALGPEFRGTLAQIGIGTYLGGGSQFVFTWTWIGVLFPLVLLAPNSMELMRSRRPGLERPRGDALDAVRPLQEYAYRLRWRPSTRWAALVSVMGAMGLLGLSGVSEFLYFQF